MPTFVINLNKIVDLQSQLAKQLEDRAKELEEEGRQIINFDLAKITEEVSTFYGSFLDNLLKWKDLVQKENTPAEIGALGVSIEEDIYGNKFDFPYDYAEITYDNIVFIKRIRLLGVEGITKKRYLLEGLDNPNVMENPYSATSLRLIQNIVEITKSPKDLAFEELFQCKREAWPKDSKYLSGATYPPYRYTWDELSSNFFLPRPIYDSELTEEQLRKKIEEYERKSLVSRRDLEAQERLIQENKEKLLQLAEEKKEKAPTPVDFWKETEKYIKKVGGQQAQIINSFFDRFSFGCILQEALNCVKPGNINCRLLFENLSPDEIIKRLQLVFPKGSDTFKAIEAGINEALFGPNVSQVLNDIRESDLETKIKENEAYLEELRFRQEQGEDVVTEINNLQATTEQYRGHLGEQLSRLDLAINSQPEFNFSERLKEEMRRGGGSLEVILSQPMENEREGALTISQKVIAAIDLIIPIEDLCESVTQLLSGRGLPDFKFPDPEPLNDIFGDFSFKISEAFLRLITQALITLVEGIITDLLNCDNLDKFVADLLDGNPLAGNDLLGKASNSLNDMYSPERMDEIIKNNTDAFLNTIASQSNNIFSVGNASGSVNFGIRPEDFRNLTINQQDRTAEELTANLAEAGLNTAVDIAQQLRSKTISPIAAQQARANESQWDIDDSKTRFVLVSGVKIINLEAFDQYLNNLLNKVSIENFSPRAVAEAGGSDSGLVEESSVSQAVTDNPDSGINITPDQADQFAEDMSCIMRHITSLIPPTQVLALLAGNATQQTLSIATQVINSCSPGLLAGLLPNNNAVDNFFGNFGNITGLGNLQDELQELSETPQFSQLFPVNRCGRYRSVEEFREDLMTQVLEPEEARRIMEEMEQERINRFNEITRQMLEAQNGNVTSGNIYNPNKLLADAIKHILDSENAKEQPGEGSGNFGNIDKQIEDEIESTLEDSPVYQNMFNSALDSLFLPLKQVFNNDIDGFIDAQSDTVEVEKPITRTIRVNTENGPVTSINPDFKDMINNGLVPVLTSKDGSNPDDRYAKMVEKDSLETFELFKSVIEPIGFADFLPEEPINLKSLVTIVLDNPDNNLYISGEPSKNYIETGLNGVPLRPVLKKENQKVVGDSLFKNLNNFNIVTTTNDGYLQIDLSGFLNVIETQYLNALDSFIDIQPIIDFINENKPKWDISFIESITNNKITNTISLVTNGKYYTPGNQLEDFYFPDFSLTQVSQRSDSVFDLLEQKHGTTDISRKDSFDNLLFNKIKPFIFDRANESLKTDFSVSSNTLYSSLIDAFIRTSLDGIANSDLLKKVSEGQTSFTKLESLQLTKECEHILDFDGLRKEFNDIYTSLKKKYKNLPKTPAQLNGTAKRPSPLSGTTMILLTKMIVRVMCVDTLIKAMLAFDYYKYAKNIVENEFFTNLICEFVHSELVRISQDTQNLDEAVYEIVKVYYNIKVEAGDFEEITIEEKRAYRSLGLSYPIEMKKIIQSEFSSILEQIKRIAGVEETSQDINDFMKFIIDAFPTLKVHNSIGIDAAERQNILQNAGIDDSGFIVQKYLLFPKVNRDSYIVKSQFPQYFTEQKLDEIDNYGVLDFDRAKELFTEIYRATGNNMSLFTCDKGEEELSLFKDPIRAGLRIVHVSKKNLTGPQYQIRNQQYPFYQEICQYYKSGYIKEVNNEYDLITIADEQVKINRDENIQSFTQRNNLNYYNSEFYPILIKDLYNNLDANVLFTYSLPLKELSSMIIMHAKLANNSVKMKYLLETTKQLSSQMFETMSTIGIKTNSSRRLRNMLDGQLANRQNVGNPAGPIDFDALKPFYRTPIQILKGLVSTSDPNVAITDKLAALASTAGAATGNKIFIPYSLASLALLPFPVFTPPPAGIIPPLTAYNITTPLFLPFFALEPLLWDLPWFKDNNAQSLPRRIKCEDEQDS